MATGYVIPGISYIEILKTIDDNPAFGIIWPYNPECRLIHYSPGQRMPKNSIEPKSRISTVGDQWRRETQRESYIHLNMSKDTRHAWFYGYAGSHMAFNAILDLLGDDYFGLSEHDELYDSYVPDSSRI